jgi:hypothetical protein
MPLPARLSWLACTKRAPSFTSPKFQPSPSRGGVHRLLQPLHRGARLVAHEVEAEAVDAVVAHPDHGAVDHQPLHHAVLGGGVVAAGAGGDAAFGVEPVVVAGHQAVEHALRVLAAGTGVVVDLVHANAQPGGVERQHHGAELAQAHRAVVGIGGVAALGGVEVQRVVAPVEAVAGGLRHHALLLLGAVGRQRRQRGAVGRGAAALGHGGQVEGGQQVDVGHAGGGQPLQVRHAVAAGVREAEVGAAVRGGHGGVADGEVAHVQLVHHHVGG